MNAYWNICTISLSKYMVRLLMFMRLTYQAYASTDLRVYERLTTWWWIWIYKKKKHKWITTGKLKNKHMHMHTDHQTRKLGYQNARTWTTCTNKPEVASPNAYVHIHNHTRTQKYLQKHFHAPCVPARSNKKSEVFWFGVLLWVTRSAWFMFAFTCCLSWRILLSWWRSAMYACVCRLCECVNLAVLMIIWNVCVRV